MNHIEMLEKRIEKLEAENARLRELLARAANVIEFFQTQADGNAKNPLVAELRAELGGQK